MQYDAEFSPNLSASPAALPPLSVAPHLSGIALADLDVPCTPDNPAKVAFQITGLLGEGAMGVVHRAVQDYPQRTVALKLLKSAIAGAEAFSRFKREVELLARLNHPGVPHLYSAGVLQVDGGRVPFLAMELVQGVDIETFCKSRKLSTPGIIRLFLKICAALDAVHHAGIIHRDLSPHNILVDDAGQPKILDFGLAGFATGASSAHSFITTAGHPFGTLEFMSPEQAAGRANIDQRSDLYSLGSILYRLLSGQSPLALAGRPLLESTRRIQEDEPLLLGRLKRPLRGDLEMIAAKALAKQPAGRYQTVQELAEDLQRYLANEPIRAYRQSPLQLARKFVRRHRVVVAIAAAILLSLTIGLITTTYEALRAQSAAKQARLALADARVSQGYALSAADDYLNARTAYDAAWKSYQQDGADIFPAQLGIWNVDHHAARFVRMVESGTHFLRFQISPDERFIAISHRNGECVVRDVLTNQVCSRLFITVPNASLYFSSDAKYLVVWGGSICEVWDAARGTKCFSIPLAPGGEELATSGDLLALSQASRLRIFSLSSGKPIDDCTTPLWIHSPRLTVHGETFFIDNNWKLYKRTIDRRTILVGEIPSHDRKPGSLFPILSPDATHVAVFDTPDAHIYSVPDFHLISTIHDSAPSLSTRFLSNTLIEDEVPGKFGRRLVSLDGTTVTYVPHGTYWADVATDLCLTADTNTISLYSICSSTGVTRWKPDNPISAATLSEDGQLAAFVMRSGMITLSETSSGQRLASFDLHSSLGSDDILNVCFAGHSRILAVASTSGTVLFLDTVSGKTIRAFHTRGRLLQFCFSRSAKTAVARMSGFGGFVLWQRSPDGWDQRELTSDTVIALSLNPQGDKLLITKKDGLELWNISAAPALVRTWSDLLPRYAEWEPAGTQFVTYDYYRGLTLVNPASGQSRHLSAGQENFQHQFHTIGELGLLDITDGQITFFDLQRDVKAASLPVNELGCGDVATSVNGHQILVWSKESTTAAFADFDTPLRLLHPPISLLDSVEWFVAAAQVQLCETPLQHPSAELLNSDSWSVARAIWADGDPAAAIPIVKRSTQLSATTKALVLNRLRAESTTRVSTFLAN